MEVSVATKTKQIKTPWDWAIQIATWVSVLGASALAVLSNLGLVGAGRSAIVLAVASALAVLARIASGFLLTPRKGESWTAVALALVAAAATATGGMINAQGLPLADPPSAELPACIGTTCPADVIQPPREVPTQSPAKDIGNSKPVPATPSQATFAMFFGKQDPNTYANWAAASARRDQEGIQILGGCTWTQVKDALRQAYDLLAPCLANVGMTAALDTASQAIHVGKIDGSPILIGMETMAMDCAIKAGLALLPSPTKEIAPKSLTFVLKATD